MTDHETAARALGFKLRDCNPEGDTFAAAVADALAAERAAGRAAGARDMRERCLEVARRHERPGAAQAIREEIEALSLDEATS